MKRTHKVQLVMENGYDDVAIITETTTRRCGFLWLRTETETISYKGRDECWIATSANGMASRLGQVWWNALLKRRREAKHATKTTD